ncbi:hypothetical protein MSAN_01177400 [Mycena sanguinolenta]|uniref:F-box domain-containing protein n=1 Tax=Mycena sanguinolenta TaxID=230812 RepID=A0A8H6YHQ6_9AGAR|nr:hypothetical protein MSAN_01177400 [Mycena sanguinolenta]
MSAEGLRARIAKLDTELKEKKAELNEIHRPPKELLNELERDKILAQRQLNNVLNLDPIAHLPLEISSEIFLLCLDPFPMPGALPHCVPRLLLSICRAWTDIALSTPALWAAIHIRFPCTRGLKNILPVWLERVRNQFLSISLEVERGQVDEDVVGIIWRHGQQLKHLELFEHWGIDILQCASPGPLPSLETLTMRGDGCFRRYSLELLRLAPNLVEYLVDDIFFEVNPPKMVLPKLRRLTFGEPGIRPRCSLNVLKHLSLPQLDALKIDTSMGILLAFLEKSSPPLLELSLALRYGDADFVALAEYVPRLMWLEVWYPEYEEVENLFTVLTKPQSPFPLPNLRTLIVHLDPHVVPEHSESLWMALICALTARRTHIQVFQLTILDPLPASCMPTPDILAAIRELRTDGMQVSVSATQEPWSLFD